MSEWGICHFLVIEYRLSEVFETSRVGIVVGLMAVVGSRPTDLQLEPSDQAFFKKYLRGAARVGGGIGGQLRGLLSISVAIQQVDRDHGEDRENTGYDEEDQQGQGPSKGTTTAPEIG